jgi:hypothetical protein
MASACHGDPFARKNPLGLVGFCFTKTDASAPAGLPGGFDAFRMRFASQVRATIRARFVHRMASRKERDGRVIWAPEPFPEFFAKMARAAAEHKFTSQEPEPAKPEGNGKQ